jgi:hypothetical protein
VFPSRGKQISPAYSSVRALFAKAPGVRKDAPRSMRRTPRTVRVSSALRAAPETVWQHASTLQGMNDELWPLHISGPKAGALGSDVPLGEPLFRGVVTLLRLVVLDVHEFKLLRVQPGQAFHESSRSLTERRWEHVRTILPEPGGCVVSDELEFEPRLLPALLEAVVQRIFERRHAFLRRKFGELIARA